MRGLVAILRRMNVRHFLGRKLRTGLTILGVAAGVALVFSISIINATLLSSFRESLRELAGRAEIEVASGDQAGLPVDFVETVATTPGVERAIPVIRATTRVQGPDGAARVLIIGITQDFGALFPRNLGELGEVRIAGGFGGERDVLLGRSVASDIGASRDDRLRIETPQGIRTAEVSGTVSGGALAAFNGGRIGIMLLDGAQRTFSKPDRVDSIFVITAPDAPLGEVTRAIERRLSGGAVVGPPGERGAGLERVFNGLGTLLSLAGTVSLLVALFVVYNTMSMSLAERRREIAMAMSLGAERRQIFGAFLAEAGVFGVIAASLGIAGGLGLARILVQRAAESYELFAANVGGPLVVTTGQVIFALASGIAICLLGAYLPARRILRVAPVEALRPEASYEWTGTGRRGHMKVRIAAGLCGIALGFVAFFFTAVYPDEEWIVQVGLIGGFIGVTFILPFIVPFAVTLLRPFLTRGFGTEGRLAADALAKNPRRTTFTVAALVLTIGLVIAVASALGSYQSQVERTTTAIIGAPIYVSSRSYTGITSDQPLDGEVGDTLSSVEGVDYIYPIRSMFLNVQGGQGLMLAIDVEAALEHGATSVMSAITDDPEGFMTGLNEGGIAVAKGMAVRHDVGVGDEFELTTPSGKRSFPIAAIYNDLVSFDSFYIDYEVYRDLWKDDAVDQFGILLEEGVTTNEMVARLEDVVDEQGMAARVFRKEELIGRILSTVEGTFSLGQGIQLAALVVAAITIANTMFTAVLERRWEMGLQRAIGMGNRQLQRSVLLEAAGIGVIGGIGGAILGTVSGMLMLASMEFQFEWEIDFQFPIEMWVLGIAGGAVLAAVVGLGPSRMATRASIISSLRYE